ASLILIFVAELATPTTVVITTLGLVPVLAAAWLLSTPLAIGLTVLGIGLIGVAGAGGGLVPISGSSVRTLFALACHAPRPGGRAAGLAVRGMRPDGEVRELELSHTPIVARGRPVVAVIFRDITETNRLERAATALAHVATSMAVTQPIERMLEAVARSVVEATDAVAASVFLLDGESTLRTAGTWGLPSGF